MICFIWFWCTFAFLSPAVSGCDCYRIFSALSLLWTDFAYFHPPRWFLRNAITGVNAIPMQMIVGNCEWRHYLLREIKHLLKSRIISKFPTNIVCPHLRVNLNTLILLHSASQFWGYVCVTETIWKLNDFSSPVELTWFLL